MIMIRISILSAALLLSIVTFCQNVGIGTSTPTYPLTVVAQNARGIAQKSGDVEIGFFTSTTSAFIQTWSNHNLNFATNNASAQMTLSTAGNLGIGTSTPTARLDVNGQIRIRGGNPQPGFVLTATDANGNAEWRINPKSGTRVLYLSHPAFLPSNSVFGYATVTPGVARRPSSDGAATQKMLAPLLLPVGAIIKEITWFFRDGRDTQDLTMQLVRDESGSLVPVSSVTSSGSSNMERTLSVALNHALGNHFYWLEVSTQSWPVDFSFLISGAKITYEL
jgi:hypothetical protein